MAAKLGEILVKTGAMTQTQLDAALKSQLILGGHLGTSLIELGYVDEDTLGEALSRMYGVPYAPPRFFADIREPTIGALPRKLAEEYEAIPIKAEDKVIQIALVNAGDLRVVDELSFSVGRRVVPWIAPEVRIYQALERYYGIERRPRYISLGAYLDEAVRRNLRGTANIVKTPEPIAPTAVSEPTAAVAGFDDGHDLAFGYGRSWLEIAEGIDRQEAPAPPPEAPRPMPLSVLAERYCGADCLEDLASAALEFSVGRAERMLLMKVRAGRATVWLERGLDLTDEKRRPLSFQVNSEPVLQLLIGADYFFGALPPRKDFHFSYRKLGVEPPIELLLIPIRVNDLLVAVALVDGGRQGRIRGDAEEFLTAFRAFGMCVSLLAMRRKIRVALGAEAPTAPAQVEPAESEAAPR